MAGLPESEEDYRLERPESTPESEWNAGLAERMARTAYRYGVPPGSYTHLPLPSGKDDTGIADSHPGPFASTSFARRPGLLSSVYWQVKRSLAMYLSLIHI